MSAAILARRRRSSTPCEATRIRFGAEPSIPHIRGGFPFTHPVFHALSGTRDEREWIGALDIGTEMAAWMQPSCLEEPTDVSMLHGRAGMPLHARYARCMGRGGGMEGPQGPRVSDLFPVFPMHMTQIPWGDAPRPTLHSFRPLPLYCCFFWRVRCLSHDSLPARLEI